MENEDWFDEISKIKGLYIEKLFLVYKSNYIYTIHSLDKKRYGLRLGKIDNIVPFGFKPDRGKILNSFAKIEFLTSKIILASLNPNFENLFSQDIMSGWDFLLDEISLSRKINYIKKLLNPSDKKIIENKMYKLKDIRNLMAHTLDDKYIIYDGKDLRNNYDIFKEDIYEVWDILIKLYITLWNQEKLYNFIISSKK